MTFRYSNATPETIKRAANLLNQMHADAHINFAPDTAANAESNP
jgi:hypothetical protein